MPFRCHKPDLLAEKYVTSQRDFSFLINLSWSMNRTIELCPSYQPLTTLKISSTIPIKKIMAVFSSYAVHRGWDIKGPLHLKFVTFCPPLFSHQVTHSMHFSPSLFLYLPKSFPVIQMVFLNFIK